MNRSIIRLFGVVILLFAILVVWTSRWTVFSATALQNNKLNSLQFFASLKVRRGEILADDHAVLARSKRAQGGTWTRTYPTGGLFSQALGYFIPEQSRITGLESARNTELKGLQNAFTSVFGSFNGEPTVGDDVYTTLDPTAQEEAKKLLAGRVGSVVAIVPQTGAVKVMYSNPTYDNNDPDACATTPGCSEFNGATQGTYPPGSTFKLVTTAAALDTGKYTPESEINGHGPIMISGHPLENDGGEEYGDVSLTTALTDSINVVFAQVGEALGANVMQEYMERFGFYSWPPMDYPVDQMSKSGEYFYRPDCDNHSSTPKLLPVTNPCVDLGRTAIGQANLGVTPLQMAMVVSAIANDGKLMQPRLTNKVVNNDGQVVETISPQEDDQVMRPSVAREMQTMMRNVVEEGTGTAANLEGLDIAGKTGTASTGETKDGQPLDDAWFVGFPQSDPRIAVAVVLPNIPNGYGGQFAAPIAAQVIKTLLDEKQ